MGNTLGVLLFLGIGFLLEIIVKRLVLPKLFTTDLAGEFKTPSQNIEKLTTSLLLELPSILGLLFFFGAAYFTYTVFIWTNSPFLRLVFLASLITITFIRLVLVCSRIIFSPSNHSLRPLPLECSISQTIHRLIVWTFGYTITGLMFIVVTKKLGAQQETTILLQLFLASFLLLVTAFLILFNKKRISDLILASTADGDEPSWVRRQFASIWHIPALMYLLTLWLLLFYNLTSVTPGTPSRGAFLLSFFILPIWIVADMTLQWIVRYSMDALKIYSEDYDDGELTEQEEEIRARGKATSQRVLLIARAGLILGIIVWVASLWNIKIPFFSKLSSVIFDALIITTLAMLFWKFSSNWIERKIAESIPEGEEDKDNSDDEWGGAANRGRSYTLLPMVRKFIGTILMTVVTLTILSAIGVDIGPLLAGAGVVGLAIGFGAQKLVADMLSGFFYLLDDAFRVGEYIEAGGISGAVENISLRNVMLRHHRGMLQIVPHSELGSITNYMRGGIVVKFNLDFPYDADIDKIRKIIKKVGIAMLEDEEIGEDFLKPVKSQGVREITNSVMTIRVKFTAKPGTHFVIRREAYKRITEALRKQGINYAHKKVIVDLPLTPDGTPAASQDEIAKAAGAAAQRIAEEETANSAGVKPS